MGPGALLYTSSLRLVTNPALRTLIWREQIDFRMSFPHSRLYPPFVRRVLIGIATGLPAAALIYSPWGKQSGAHLNPSTTLTSLGWQRSSPRMPVF
jgi:glycerol uptake facilitator-like aquaporin